MAFVTVVNRPANDLFSNRTILSDSSATVAGTSINATSELVGEEPRNYYSVWWEWRPPTDAIARISRPAEFGDLRLTISTGDAITNLNAIGVLDRYNASGTSNVMEFVARSNVAYVIGATQVGPYTQGEFSFHLELEPLPSNDHFANAVSFS